MKGVNDGFRSPFKHGEGWRSSRYLSSGLNAFEEQNQTMTEGKKHGKGIEARSWAPQRASSRLRLSKAESNSSFRSTRTRWLADIKKTTVRTIGLSIVPMLPRFV
jgi:hypothetical protein